MPPHPSFNHEKSPIDQRDYGGLQLDTRAKENKDKDLDPSKPQGYLDDDFDDEGNYLHEKQAHTGVGHHTAPPSGSTGQSPIIPGVNRAIDEAHLIPPSTTTEKKICGLRRRHFWELLGLLLALVTAAAVVGGVVGGLQARNGSPSPSRHSGSSNSSPNGTNATTSTSLQSSDVMIGSPLSIISYDEGPGPANLETRQSFRVYYQSAIGNIKEAISSGMTSWQSATPIFTDAMNNTGLATITYINQSSQQGTIYYVGLNGLLQEKRKIFNSTAYWEPGTLGNVNIPAVGNTSVPLQQGDPQNNWDGYRMAAVYSENFHSGPGARLFYHAEQLNGTSYVQEMIWTKSNDSWAMGAKLSNPSPNTHMTATIDESTKILRLLYSSGNKTLSEEWINISNANAVYASGLNLENLLENNSADIAAVSANGTTFVYHYSSSNQTAEPGIHELTITGDPGSVNNQEAYNLSSPLVAAPMLTILNNTALYQPIGASTTVVAGLSEQLYVFWADKPTGDLTTTATGYGELEQISRPFSASVWSSTGQMVIPLGDDNSQPSSSGSR